MADEPKQTPEVTEGVTDRAQERAQERALAAQRERAERLAGALRKNLRRRNPTERKISERPGVAGAQTKDQAEDQEKDG
ncbi:MAG: hypothetical protein K0Q70_447 [Rhodospirillales bacterium]|jgi:hypothetical protein|nr:hypothetical protein [Rhodospirillales bacterium]